MPKPFSDRIEAYRQRVEARLDALIPAASVSPSELHEAMRYAVLSGGKRVRPLLVYASGECLGIDADALDAPAASVELIHAFSLVHDDLPAMDDDDLRRGMPTAHRKFGEATAILAGDALLPLAFAAIADARSITAAQKASLVSLIAAACGSLGMTGGQALDLAAEGRRLDLSDLERMQELKTGALLHASIAAAACLAESVSADDRAALDTFGRSIGLAFQIRDDLLDVEGQTETIGKPAGSDLKRDKATWPALFGVAEAARRCAELVASAHAALDRLGERSEPLRWMAGYVADRNH